MFRNIVYCIDIYYEFPSRSEEFIEIFQEEKGKYKDVTDVGDNHHISNELEYFASVFSDIILRGKDSLGDIPRTYEFVMRYMG